MRGNGSMSVAKAPFQAGEKEMSSFGLYAFCLRLRSIAKHDPLCTGWKARPREFGQK